MYRVDADGVGLRRAAARGRGSAAVICRGDGVRASPLVNNTHSTYDPVEWSKDGRDTCDGRERSYVTESLSSVISA